MKLTSLHATAVLSITTAQSGSVEWTRKRGGAASTVMGFTGFVRPVHPCEMRGKERQQQQRQQQYHVRRHEGSSLDSIRSKRRSLRRPRSSLSRPTGVLCMGYPAAPDFFGGITRPAFDVSSAAEMPVWMTTLASLDDRPEMPFDEMADMSDQADQRLGLSGLMRKKKAKRRQHYDLKRSPALLKRQEEVDLGRKVQELLRWERVRTFLEVKSGRPPTMEEWAAEVAVMDGAEGMARDLEEMREARERMIACNLRLVLHISRKMFFSGRSGGLKVGLDDMIQDGTAGLVKAVERFDPEKGFRFSTYASWWVHQGIHAGLAGSGRVIRLPVNVHTFVCRVVRSQSTLVDQLGREPTHEEIALACGLAADQVAKYININKLEPISFDGNAYFRHTNSEKDSKARKVEDTIASTQEQEPVVGADVTLLRTDVDTILSDLTDREAAVIRMRFGIGGSTPSTLDSVGRRLRVTRERVRQIQVVALEKLRDTAPTHQVLCSDRGGSRPRQIEWPQPQEGLPSTLVSELVKQALEARVNEREEGRRRETVGVRRKKSGKGRPRVNGVDRDGLNGKVVDEIQEAGDQAPARSRWRSLQTA